MGFNSQQAVPPIHWQPAILVRCRPKRQLLDHHLQHLVSLPCSLLITQHIISLLVLFFLTNLLLLHNLLPILIPTVVPCAAETSGQDALDAYLVAHDPSTGSVTLAISGTIPTSITSLAVIDAQFACRHFHVKFGAVLRLNYLHLINGRSTDSLEGGGSIRTYGTFARLINILDPTTNTFNPTNDGTLAAISHCKFSNNFAVRGGAIQVTGLGTTQSNGADRFMWIDGNSKVEISDSTFFDNTASSYGGALDGQRFALVDVKRTDFISNKITGPNPQAGGAFYLRTCDWSEIINSTFVENDGFKLGGAVYVDSSVFTCRGCTFDKNKLSKEYDTFGGAFYLNYDVVLTLADNTTITNHGSTKVGSPCTQECYAGGGGIFSYSRSTINLRGVTMMYNAAKNGGGIFAQQSK